MGRITVPHVLVIGVKDGYASWFHLRNKFIPVLNEQLGVYFLVFHRREIKEKNVKVEGEKKVK